MSKELYYFKFIVADWLTGDIVFEDLSVQGLFINICALYVHRDAKLTIKDILKRYPESERLAKLTDRFISVSDGYISIKFLDEQIAEFKAKSLINSVNGSMGGRPSTLKKKPNALRPLTERLAKKSQLELERELDNNIIYLSKDARNFFSIGMKKFAGLPSELVMWDEFQNSFEMQISKTQIRPEDFKKEFDKKYIGKDWQMNNHVKSAIGATLRAMEAENQNPAKNNQNSKISQLKNMYDNITITEN